MSRTFTDGLGREWTIEISLANSRRMKEAAGISIEQLAPDMSGNAKSQKEAIEPVLTFLGDPFRAFAAFYGLVKPAADERKLSMDQVLEGFPDEASVERMVQAIMAAVCHFFQKSPRRLAVAKMIQKNFDEWLRKVNGAIERGLNKIDFGAALDAMPEIDADALNASLAGRLRSSATDSPATSEVLTPSAAP
jgi:hypothetical protein